MLFLEIRKNRKLAAKRNPMYDKNRFAKFLIYLGIAFWAAYLLFLGVMLSFALREGFPNMEPYHILNQVLVFFLVLDFLVRFIFPDPIQEIKPYLLLPVARRKVLGTFLAISGLEPFNLFWLFFFAPFALLTVTRFYGLTGVIGYLLGIWLLMVMNCYWSLLIRVLKKHRFLHLLWAVLVYGILALLEFLPEKGWVSRFCMDWGEGCILWNPLSFLAVLAGIAVLVYINYRVQLRMIKMEVARTETTKVSRRNWTGFLDRFGTIGDYMRLELKLIFRNKLPRNQFWGFMVLMGMFAAALAFQVYGDDSYMNNFVCLYCYCILGTMSLNQLMSAEGNYIDGLLVRKESIYHLLRAKYYIHCTFLILPFAFSLIPVIEGSIPLLMSVAYMLFTAGVVFAAMMQVAVTNSKTTQLNQTAIGKQQPNNMYQFITAIDAFTVPLLINKLLALMLGEEAAYWALIVLGLAGIVTHRWWLKNIYQRMMKRKYQNLEGFRNTR